MNSYYVYTLNETVRVKADKNEYLLSPPRIRFIRNDMPVAEFCLDSICGWKLICETGEIEEDANDTYRKRASLWI